jgi:hypothetical protein
MILSTMDFSFNSRGNSPNSTSFEANAIVATSPTTSQVPNFLYLSKYQVTVPPAIAHLSASNLGDLTPLPSDFTPGEFDVVCGRGKGSYNAPGCKKLRALIREYIPEYTAARSKFDKTTVLSQIVDVIQSQSNHTAKFVKKDASGAWCEISNDQAREKVGHTMRETIAILRSKAMDGGERKAGERGNDSDLDVETKSEKRRAIMESFKSLRRCSKMSQLKKAHSDAAESS